MDRKCIDCGQERKEMPLGYDSHNAEEPSDTEKIIKLLESIDNKLSSLDRPQLLYCETHNRSFYSSDEVGSGCPVCTARFA